MRQIGGLQSNGQEKKSTDEKVDAAYENEGFGVTHPWIRRQIYQQNTEYLQNRIILRPEGKNSKKFHTNARLLYVAVSRGLCAVRQENLN